MNEFLPFPPIIVKDKRHDDYINMENFVPPSKILIDWPHVGSSNSSYKQWDETCVKLANSPLRAVTHSVASSPHSSAFDEYNFTTEEEDELLKGSEEGVTCLPHRRTNRYTSWPKANQQASNLSAVQEPSVTEVFKSKDSILKSDNNITITVFSCDTSRKKMRASKRKTSIQPEFQPCRKQLKWDCYQPVPVCLLLEDCGVSIPPASFKIPSLHPAKRPPFRAKKSRTNSTGSRERITDSRTNKLRTSLPSEDVIQDDTISIIADTEVTVEAEDESLLGENRPFIENWVENVNSAATSDRNTPTDCGGFRLEQRQADNVALPKTTKNNTILSFCST
nr:unnamed protein product [Callosobruchus chinensis]